MQLRIFQANGYEEIKKMHDEINQWIVKHHVRVENTQASMCTVTSDPEGEHWQHLVICVWYSSISNPN